MEKERKAFTPAVDEDLDVQLTALCEIKKVRKEPTANEAIQIWCDFQTEQLTIQELAEYAADKKGDKAAKQWAEKEIVRKITGGKI